MEAVTKENHPILVGVGQVTYREKIKDSTIDSLDLAAEAVNLCVADTGRSDILNIVDSISLVSMFSNRHHEPVEHLCEKIGVRPGIREETAFGGNSPQFLVNRAADHIAAGKISVALLVGGEALYNDRPQDLVSVIYNNIKRLKKATFVVGDNRDGYTPHEALHKIDMAPRVYPMFENALRHNLGMTSYEHRKLLKDYYRQMAAIASENPYAWFHNGNKIEDITHATPGNKMIAFPYTKFMNPSPYVNQAAALILTNTRTARRLSIPRDRWVYLHGGAEAADKWFVSERVNYYSSPAIEQVVSASLGMAGLSLSDIDFFDLYSCFPCAAITAATSIGLSIDNLPPLSITGGLFGFGAPGNNYTMHAISQTVERLRKNPSQYGLITAMGIFLTKHAAGIYSGVPPKVPWERHSNHSMQKKIDEMESPALCGQPLGKATVETYTVLHESEQDTSYPIVVARLDSGERCFATTKNGNGLAVDMEKEEFIGRRGQVTPGNNTPNIIRF